jgi:hypothetical protein
MRRSALSLLTCVLAANVNTRAAEPAKIELMVLKTVTVTEEQFLLGSQDGQPSLWRWSCDCQRRAPRACRR